MSNTRLAEEGTKGFRSNGNGRANAAPRVREKERTMNRPWSCLAAILGSIVLGGGVARAASPAVLDPQSVLRYVASDPDLVKWFRVPDDRTGASEIVIAERCAEPDRNRLGCAVDRRRVLLPREGGQAHGRSRHEGLPEPRQGARERRAVAERGRGR
jgi:hypothetical protein